MFQIAISLEKNLLSGVLSQHKVREEGAAEPDHPRMMSANQLRVRLPVSIENFSNDVAIFDDRLHLDSC
jgi:hypothetical protein